MYPMNSMNTVVGGGGDSGVWMAPLGTTGPTNLAEPTDPFKALGWLSEDGVDDELKWKKDDFRGHQGGAIVRSIYSEPERTFKFQCLEHTALTLGLRHGTTYTTTGGVAKAVQRASAPKPFAWVVDEFDAQMPAEGGTWLQDRWVIPNGTVDPSGTLSYKISGMTILEFLLTPVGDVIHYTNRPGVVSTP